MQSFENKQANKTVMKIAFNAEFWNMYSLLNRLHCKLQKKDIVFWVTYLFYVTPILLLY